MGQKYRYAREDSGMSLAEGFLMLPGVDIEEGVDVTAEFAQRLLEDGKIKKVEDMEPAEDEKNTSSPLANKRTREGGLSLASTPDVTIENPTGSQNPGDLSHDS